MKPTTLDLQAEALELEIAGARTVLDSVSETLNELLLAARDGQRICELAKHHKELSTALLQAKELQRIYHDKCVRTKGDDPACVDYTALRGEIEGRLARLASA